LVGLAVRMGDIVVQGRRGSKGDLRVCPAVTDRRHRWTIAFSSDVYRAIRVPWPGRGDNAWRRKR